MTKRAAELVAHSSEFCGVAHALAEPGAGRDELADDDTECHAQRYLV